jgi:hypothetical protein
MDSPRPHALLLGIALTVATAALAGCGAGEAVGGADAGGCPDGGSGDACGCERADGAWSAEDSLGADGAFMNAWGPSPTEVYIVGGQPDAGVMRRFDGERWSPVEIPAGPMLYWVHGVAGELFAVGAGGRALHRDASGAWRATQTGTEVALWGVFAAAPDEAWAVGGDPFARPGEGGGLVAPTLLRFDGDTWSPVELPVLDRNCPALFKVWGTGPDDLHAVGAAGVALHFDGTQWRQVQTGTSDDFVSLWGRAADDVVAVGGRANGMMARWDGTAWTSQVLAQTPGLNGVWMASDGTAWASGLRATIVRIAPGSFSAERQSFASPLTLHGMFGFDCGPLLGVGGSLMAPPPYTGLVVGQP